MTKYLNMKTSFGVETVDQISTSAFSNYSEYKAEVRRLVSEYHMCGMGVYVSSRSTKDWRGTK